MGAASQALIMRGHPVIKWLPFDACPDQVPGWMYAPLAQISAWLVMAICDNLPRLSAWLDMLAGNAPPLPRLSACLKCYYRTANATGPLGPFNY